MVDFVFHREFTHDDVQAGGKSKASSEAVSLNLIIAYFFINRS